ncbi:MAG TPA: AAA family ATPase [Solirubrobacteraceae bacterium]|nr:AAA family ATPase [Solirubrobacteraceae bacterium]
MPASGQGRGVWRREGEGWIVGLGDQRTFMRDSKGLGHLAELLARPGEEVSALDLVAGRGTATESAGVAAEAELATGGHEAAGPALDPQAKAEYRRRLDEAHAEIEEAERFHDPERAARARLEVEFITRELSAAVGLGGRDRPTGSAAERARLSATRAIRTTIDRIAKHDAPLARHLRASVRTGTYCSYGAGDAERVEWDFAGEPPPPAPAPEPEPAAAPAAPPPALLEREVELAVIEAALDRAAGGAGVVLAIEGEAGIGKSELLAHAGAAARARGFTVLRSTSTTLDHHAAFGVARQLFEPALRRLDDARRRTILQGAVVPAAELLGHAERQGGEPAERFDVINGLFWLTAALAEERPVAILADDLHWADEQSLDWLQYTAARAAEARVLLVLAARSAPEDAASAALADLLGASAVERLAPGSLSRSASDGIVRATWPEADDEFCRACHGASGGNPLYLREILAAARAEGIEPTAAHAARLGRITPASVSRLILLRLKRLDAQAQALARACALLGHGATLSDAGALAELDSAETLAAADTLVAGGILRAADPLAFTHPFVQSTVEHEIGLGARPGLHARAAALLDERGAPAEAVAAHLVHALPAAHDRTAAVLLDAARDAMRHSAPQRAAQLLERALREPPPPALLADVLLELARALKAIGRGDDAARHLERALGSAEDPRVRAELTLELTRLPGRGVDDSIGRIDDAIAGLGDADRDLRFRLEAAALESLGDAFMASPHPEVKRRRDERVAAVAREARGDSEAERELLVIHAVEQAVEARISAAEAKALALRALQDGRLMRALAEGAWNCDSAVEVLVLADAFVDAEQHARRAERHARERGSIVAQAFVAMLRSVVALHRGAILDAEAQLRSTFAVTVQLHDPYVEYQAHQVRVCTSLERGDLDEAERACEALAELGASPIGVAHAYGRFHAAAGRHELALPQLRSAHDMLATLGRWRSVAMGPVAPDLVATLVALGERDDALALAQEELERARRFGAPSAIAGALLALGAATGGDDGREHVAQAVAILADSTALLWRARAHAALGRADGDAGSLRLALDLAERCGATRLAGEVRDELAALGEEVAAAPAAGAAVLNATQRRAAELAADGASDLEIAQALFLNVRVVEEQLAIACAQLGVASRDELRLVAA